MAHETQVVKYLRKKENDGFNSPITWLGSKPCFISPIRNSSLNNLEEQLILGTDNYLSTYEDNEGNVYVEQSFCTANLDIEDSADYYRLFSVIYKEPRMYGDIVFERDTLEISSEVNVVFGGPDKDPYTDVNTVYFLDNRFSFGDEDNELIISDPLGGYVKTRQDDLYFVKEGQQKPLNVLTKITGTKNVGGAKVSYSKIYNHLLGSE